MYVEFNEGVYTRERDRERERELKNDDAYKPWDTIDSLAWPLFFLAVHVRIIIIAVNYNGSLVWCGYCVYVIILCHVCVSISKN